MVVSSNAAFIRYIFIVRALLDIIIIRAFSNVTLLNSCYSSKSLFNLL